MRKDLVASAVLLLVASLYYWATTDIPTTTLSDDIGPRGLPNVLSILLALLAIGLGARALLAAPVAAPEIEDDKEKEASTLRAFGLLLVGALYVPAAYARGYVPAIFLLVVAIAAYEGARVSWRLFAVAAGGAAIFWLLFVQALGIPQPDGVLLPSMFSEFRL